MKVETTAIIVITNTLSLNWVEQENNNAREKERNKEKEWMRAMGSEDIGSYVMRGQGLDKGRECRLQLSSLRSTDTER